MENKQTAVSWLFTQLDLISLLPREEWVVERKRILRQADEMFREQIVEAFKHGELPPLFVNLSAEQYYEETYAK